MSLFGRERWLELSPYLDRTLERTGVRRVAWLDALRGEDPGLAADLESLLEEGRAAEEEGFLEGSPVPSVQASLAGQTIGSYKLVSLIARGGTGGVWLAHRIHGRFADRVAVKILNPSLISHASGERFEREGSILGRLMHPGIAQLIDAGVTPTGQRYLVLEYVEGEHIDRHCDARILGIAGRVRLFLDLLEAVAHAHTNSIVHRDIKPSNVLVGRDGRVKLLDFGIAELREGEAVPGQSTALTRERGLPLTPEFAAPEQLLGGGTTAATDVYALGVLLYLLLAGCHPAGPAWASPSDLLKAVLHTDPPPPSSVVCGRTQEQAEMCMDAAAQRATTPDELQRLLKGDLDTIVAKALKKNAEGRYPSVTAFADDLRRYLARRPSAPDRKGVPPHLRPTGSRAIFEGGVPMRFPGGTMATVAGGAPGWPRRSPSSLRFTPSTRARPRSSYGGAQVSMVSVGPAEGRACAPPAIGKGDLEEEQEQRMSNPAPPRT